MKKKMQNNYNKTMLVMFEGMSEFKKRDLDLVSKREKFIQPMNHILFENVPLYYRFMTPQKQEILSLIVQKSPDSIFKLAQMVERDYGSVLKDCNTLCHVGFIRLEDLKDNRNTKRPVLAFDYNKILVKLPNATLVYQLDHI